MTAIVFILLLIGLTATGGGVRNARSFWLGLFEALLLAILIFPVEAGGFVANILDLLAQFGSLLQTNVTLSIVWGIVGLILALQRLYYVDARV